MVDHKIDICTPELFPTWKEASKVHSGQGQGGNHFTDLFATACFGFPSSKLWGATTFFPDVRDTVTPCPVPV